MKVLLIDADSTIPNLVLMKLSAHHKMKGDTVNLVRAKIPYYPSQKKRPFNAPDGYDKTYCSAIFQGNKEYIKGENIIFGGTGVDLKTSLPEDIENLSPDYSIYPENNVSYGFITRGCIRKCSFCFVPEKEGYIHKVDTIDNIAQHKKVKFMDNNILAYSRHKDILQELVEKQIRCQFNQGLDIRLLDDENSKLLSNLNYDGEYIFAFDSWRYRNIISDKLNLLSWRRDWQIKFYVYVNPEMPIKETTNRINYLKERKCLPYIMRDISCWDSVNKDFYTDVASYCNQPSIFKSMDFFTFLKKRTKNKERINKSFSLYQSVK